MKKYVLPVAFVALGLSACDQQTSAPASAPAAAAEPVTLETTDQRVSYAIAYTMSARVSQEPYVELDEAAFLAGANDAIKGETRGMSLEEIQAEMQAFQERLMALYEEQQAAQEARMAQSATENLIKSQAFLTKNRTRGGISVTDSGLQYEVLTQGTGARPGPDDVVQVHYRGTLSDGTQFDSSYDRGNPVSFGVGQVIPGWTEALQLMPVGSKWKLYIPPELGYGEGGAPGGAIPPNSALVFEVELLSIPSQDQAAQAEGAG